jgi:diketogulonate reductase-like aldo/keto reductase
MKPTTTLGHSTLTVNRIGLGCMGMSEFYGSFDEKEFINTLHKAVDLGVNFFDTADMYGWGANERLLGKAFKGRCGDPTANFLDSTVNQNTFGKLATKVFKIWALSQLICITCIGRILKWKLKK